jgi:hypothetical protein
MDDKTLLRTLSELSLPRVMLAFSCTTARAAPDVGDGRLNALSGSGMEIVSFAEAKPSG